MINNSFEAEAAICGKNDQKKQSTLFSEPNQAQTSNIHAYAIHNFLRLIN